MAGITLKKGQISIAAMISIGLSILIPTIGGYFYQSRRTDDKVQAVDVKLGTVSERTAKLEENISYTREDIKEIKADVKSLLKVIK